MHDFTPRVRLPRFVGWAREGNDSWVVADVGESEAECRAYPRVLLITRYGKGPKGRPPVRPPSRGKAG